MPCRRGLRTPGAIRCAITWWSSALFCVSTFAQPGKSPTGAPVKFEHLSDDHGLSQNTVQRILQDRRGFMWFGTQDGLNRYDGYRFIVYKPDPGNPRSLSENRVESLYEDRHGFLWIGTQNRGLNRFDPATETFEQYQFDARNPRSLCSNNVISLHEDRSGVLWVGTDNGLAELDRASGTFRHYKRLAADSTSLSHNAVSCILEDRTGILWVGTWGGGLNRMQRDETGTVTFRRYQHDPKVPYSLSDDIVRSIAEDPAGALWVGTRSGVSRLVPQDRSAGRFSRFENDPANPRSLSDNNVWPLHVDHSGVLWIGTHGGGLNRLTPGSQDFQVLRHDPQDAQSLSGNDIFSIYEDRSGGVWIGTRDGIDRWDRASTTFRHYRHDPKNRLSLSDNSVWGIYEDRATTIWIGTAGGGLNRFDRATGTFRRHQHDPANPWSLPNNSIWTIYQDRAGVLWVGTEGGLARMVDDGAAGSRFQRFGRSQGLSHNRVTAIHEGVADSLLWIGTWGGGLDCWNRVTGTFKNYRHDPADGGSPGSNGVWLIHEDRTGTLWLALEAAGLDQFDRATGTFRHFRHEPGNPNSLSSNSIWSIHEGRDGTLWIGTRAGLNRFDRQAGTFTHFREKDGLPNEVIYGILEDDHGNLWLSTNKGLSKFDPRNETFRNYDVHDGLQSNEFNVKAFFRARNGEMLFGGINGFNIFHPDSIRENTVIPPVLITALNRYNTELAGGIAIPEKGISLKSRIELTYKDEILIFEAAALNFHHSIKNKYAYKLEGLNDRWIQLGTKREITFTSLDPGDYTLRVMGSNNDGVWNEEGAALEITIAPPWWRTAWAYGLYVLLVLLVVFVIDRTQRRRLLARERARAELRETELRAQAAEAQARTLLVENERKELELQKAGELKTAHQALKEAHENLKATQEQLVTQQKLASLGQLTAGIAHEIKNPLNFVNNFAALSIELAGELREELAGSGAALDPPRRAAIESLLADIQQNAEKITHHGRRADSIVKSMMQHARGSSGQREPAEVNMLLDEAVTLVYHGLRAQDASFNVTIEKDYDASVGKVNVVPQSLQRVFLNLINNACYAAQAKAREGERRSGRVGERESGRMGEWADRSEDSSSAPSHPLPLSPSQSFKPTLSVATKNLGDRIEIRVRDNGTGIPAEARDRMFTPFFTTKPTGQGTGLGLSISHDIIVQEHRGEIRVETEEGKFTEFVVRIPRVV